MNYTEEERKEAHQSRFKYFCSAGKLEELKISIQENGVAYFDCTQGLLLACKNGKLEVVQYFLETEEIRNNTNVYYPYQTNGVQYIPDGVLLHSYFDEKHEVVDYLLFNFNFEVSRDTKTFLAFHKLEDLLSKIEKRDLFFKINEDMSSKTLNTENKQSPKAKI